MSDPFVTPEAILSFPHLWKARSFKNDPANPAKYGANFLINKADPALSPILSEYNALVLEKFGEATLPYGKKSCLTDGAVRYPNDPFYTDKIILVAYRPEDDGAPEVKLDANTPVINKSDVYAGCVVRGLVNFYAYDGGTGGISCDLHAVMKVRDGEPLGHTRPDATAAFAGMQGAGPQAAPQAPAGFGMPGADKHHF